MICLCLLVTPLAMAEEDASLIAFTEGRYSEAALLGEASATADSLAFAARSLLAEAMANGDQVPPLDLVTHGRNCAETALSMDASHVEARLQLAIALSLLARPMSVSEANRSGYGGDARDLVLSVLKEDPENPYAHGFMAVWHIEVLRRGGSLGGVVMGASMKKARKHYQLAVESDPGEASTHWQYARALAAHNARKYRSEIEAALQAALAVEAETHLEAVMQTRAASFLAYLETASRKEIEKRANEML